MKNLLLKLTNPLKNTKAFGQNESDAAKGGWSIAVTVAMILAGLAILTVAAVGILGATDSLSDTFTSISTLFQP